MTNQSQLRPEGAGTDTESDESQSGDDSSEQQSDPEDDESSGQDEDETPEPDRVRSTDISALGCKTDAVNVGTCTHTANAASSGDMQQPAASISTASQLHLSAQFMDSV